MPPDHSSGIRAERPKRTAEDHCSDNACGRGSDLSRGCSVRDSTEDAGHAWQDGGALPTCAHCGGDRLISLSFTDAPPDDGGQPGVAGQPQRLDLRDRPIMKCLTCGEQLYADDVVRSQTGSN